MNIKIKINPIYLKHIEQPQFNQIFYGGSSSGKSYFLAQKIVLDNLKGVNWLCCRNIARTLRNSTFNEVRKIIYSMDLKDYYSINQTEMTITCKLNGRQIIFAGLDDTEKIKSITPQKGVIESIFIEEATECKEEAYMQLKKRLRGQSEHRKHIYMAFNPILKSHWIYRRFFNYWENNKNVYEDDDLFILRTTYKDNVFLTEQDRKLLEDESDPYFYAVYSLGEWGVLQKVIFTNWRMEDLSDKESVLCNNYYGLDFGYANDPNALIEIHYDRKHKRIYVLNEYYCCQMQDDQLVEVCKDFVKSNFISCDSEEPKSIAYLAMNGVRAIGVKKGKDSINRGIRWLQGHEIIIDTKCQHFKSEIEQYHWLEDKYGNTLPKPCDANNHLIDALRYATEQLQSRASIKAGARI